MLERLWRKGNSPTLFGRNVNWCSHCVKQYGVSLEKQKIELPYDLAISLLGIHLEKTKTLIQKDACPPIFLEALFTIAKTWKPPASFSR